MENDNRLIPRKPAIPVVAQRADSLPATGSQPLPSAPQPYVVFIQSPPASPAVAPPFAPPAVSPAPQYPAPPPQHFHTTHHAVTTTHHYHFSPRRDRRLGNSALGMASLALGVIACVVCWVPVLGLAAVPIGAIGAVFGVLGVIISTLFRRSSAALPAGGLFVCLLAAGVSIASTGSLVYWRTRLEQLIPKSITQRLDHSQPQSSSTPAASKAPAHTVPMPVIVNPAVASAAQRLKVAQQTCDERTKNSQAYRDAVAAQAQARTEAAALAGQPIGSAARLDAQSRVIAADNALSGVLDQAQRNDADVQVASRDLVAARHGSDNP